MYHCWRTCQPRPFEFSRSSHGAGTGNPWCTFKAVMTAHVQSNALGLMTRVCHPDKCHKNKSVHWLCMLGRWDGVHRVGRKGDWKAAASMSNACLHEHSGEPAPCPSHSQRWNEDPCNPQTDSCKQHLAPVSHRRSPLVHIL